MKKKLALFLALMMVFVLAAGCSQRTKEPDGGTTATPPPAAATPTPEPEAAPLKVALMLAGPVNDGGWAASAYAGLMMIKEKHGIQETFVESLAQSDFEEYFRSFASEGYDVVFGHGYQFGDAAMKVAPEFPDTKFIITSTNISQAPNVASMNTLPIENGLIQGTAAANATKSNVIGAIGGMSIPSVTDALNSYAAGALRVNPDIKVLLSLTGDFENVALVKEHAQAMIDQGADVIMYNVDAAGLGVLDVVKGTDILIIPSIADQNSMAPDNALLSGITDVSKGMLYVFDQVAAGNFEPKFYELGVDTGCVYYVPNEKIFTTALSAEGQAAVEEVFQKLGAKELDARALVEELVPATLKVG